MFDATSGEVKYFTQENGLAGSAITELFCDIENNIWIGSEQKVGLTKFDFSTGKFKILKIGEGYIPETISQTPTKIYGLGLQADCWA